MAFLTTSVNHLETREDRNLYEVVFPPPQEPLHVTVTADTDVSAEWVAMFQPAHRSFFPVGVAVHTNEGDGSAHVLTICAGRECLVFQLFGGHLSRDALVFLRDVCTCYGWKTEAYDDLFVRRRPLLSLGRLTDIQTLVPNGQNMGFGDLSMVVFGRRVNEPTVSKWTPRRRRIFKENQIRETVLEAYICQAIGMTDPNPPPNNSLTREISLDFPSFYLTSELADRKIYQVSINADQRLRVTYTRRAAVLTSWLSSLERGEMQSPRLIGIDVTYNHSGSLTIMGLAFGNECLAYNLYRREDSAGGLVPSQTFGNDVFLNSNCRFVGWSTTGESFEDMNLGLRSERVLDVKTQFPRTHSYPDLARIVLGYEMHQPDLVEAHHGDWAIMAVAVQAYVCLMGGLHFGYDNPQ